ncbi:polyribonucleotide nucleotidyltransferase [Myxococcota bacterium]|nr:polyribonucleotide nucleotidyltransferase [Myxococcota bacterium]
MKFEVHSQIVEVGGKALTIETGRWARQSGGSVVVRLGDSVVLVAANVADQPREGLDFLPLTCDYVEKTYSAGKIPGGFFRREGKPTEKEVLSSRLMDRPTRPQFPKGWRNETQLIAFVVSFDQAHDTDVLAMTGTSAALALSPAPFTDYYGAVRVGRVDGRFVANPTKEERERSDIELIVAASRDAITMVEGGGAEVGEDDMLAALEFAHRAILPLIDAQESLARVAGKEKLPVEAPPRDEALYSEVKAFAAPRIRAAYDEAGKKARRVAVKAVWAEVRERFALAADADAAAVNAREKVLRGLFDSIEKWTLRNMIFEEGRRIDARVPDEVRDIDVQVGVLPRAHGSALFTRGETQALVATTLGTPIEAQRMDMLEGDLSRKFMLHYNFPPFSVGEVRPMRGPGRREIGHGALAHRSIERVMPISDDYPYVVRVVSDVLESNGSSSMATVCGASLSLMDAGVPFPTAVAGIAMGLIKEGDKFVVLSDISGDEDHLGDMDFKVAGTARGITGFQMDIKIKGVSREIMQKALHQAREGRLHILDRMNEALAAPREEMSRWAPRIHTVMIKPDKIREVIGPGGKTIKGIQESTGTKVEVNDAGRVLIASPDLQACERAIKMIREITQEAEVGKLYLGLVKKVTDFGAFVEIFPGTDGLVHISELANERVRSVTDVVNEGDEVLVRVINIDRTGKIRLSRKEALGATE